MASGFLWEFVVPSSSTTCAEQAEEMVQFCERLYGAFGEFFVPIEINYSITKFDRDTEIRPNRDAGELVRRELRNDDGIGLSEFVRSTVLDEAGVRWIPRIPFERNRYKICSDGTDYAIERSDCIPYRNGKPCKEMAIPDPLELTVIHRPARNVQSVTTDHVLTVSVAMCSDLWLRACEDGEKNREYLRSFFSNISDAISTESVNRDKYTSSDFWNDLSVYSGDDYIEVEPEAIY
jgi:hypothetical protein